MVTAGARTAFWPGECRPTPVMMVKHGEGGVAGRRKAGEGGEERTGQVATERRGGDRDTSAKKLARGRERREMKWARLTRPRLPPPVHGFADDGEGLVGGETVQVDVGRCVPKDREEKGSA